MSRWMRPRASSRQLLEGLETRIMLTGETVVISWAGQRMEAAKDQYIVSANAATAVSLYGQLNTHGLHASNVQPLAPGFFLVTDSIDPIANVANWSGANKDVVNSLTPNGVNYKMSTLPNEANPVAEGPAISDYYIGTSLKQIGLVGQQYVIGSGLAPQGPGAWDFSTGSKNVIVAVMDTGITASTDVGTQIWTNPGEIAGDGLDNDGNGIVDDINGANFSAVAQGGVVTATAVTTDTGTHGTQVASVIGAIPNNVALPAAIGPPVLGAAGGVRPAPAFSAGGAVGVNWNVTLLPVVVFTGAENTATDAAIIAGLEYIRTLKLQGNNIVAVNMSFGRRYLGNASGIGDPGNIASTTDATTGAVTPGGDPPAIMVFDAMNRVTSQGIVVVAAAGNGPTGTGGGTNNDLQPFVPANSGNSMVITVGSSTPQDTIEAFSNYGPNSVKIAAPGTGVVASDTTGVTTAVTGSSFSAAYVSGAVALLKAFKPSLSGQQIVSLILNSADTIPALVPYIQNGRRLNILNAIEKVIGNPTSSGNLDAFTQSGASGWLFDPNQGSNSSTGTIKVDGVPLVVTDLNTGLSGTTFTAGAPRGDLIGAVGSANHGFNVQFLLPQSGNHTIQLFINDAIVDTSGRIISNNDGSIATLQTLITGSSVSNSFTQGAVDFFGPTTASGWLVDRNIGQVGGAFGAMTIDGVVQKVLDLNTGTVGTTFRANASRPDLASTFGSTNHGFNIVYVAPSTGDHKVQFFLLDSVADASGNFIAGQVAPTIINSATRTLVNHGAVDTISIPAISGWMVDQNLSDGTAIGEVKVDGVVVSVTDLNNNNRVANTFRASGARADLASIYGSTNHGFRIRLTNLPNPGSHRIQVIILDSVSDGAGGYVTTNGVRATQETVIYDQNVEGNQLPTGSLDVATTTQIAGWAKDVNAVGTTINVRIDVDGGTVAIVPANQFHSNAVGNFGFFYTPNLSQGQHRVDAYALDDFTGTPVLIGTKTIFQNHLPVTSPAGLVYDSLANTLSGYVVDPDSAFDPVSLQIVVDGNTGGQRQLLTAAASLPDPGDFGALALTQPGNNMHGFQIALPNLVSGNHLIQVFGVDNETGDKVEVLQTPVTVNHPPTGKFYRVNNNVVAEYAVNISDPDSPNTPVLYRLDVDNWTGMLQKAPSSGLFNVDIPITSFPAGGDSITLSAGTHNVKLWVVDNESHELVQISNDFFGNPAPNGVGVTYSDLGNPQRLVTGSVDVFETVNGFSYFNDAPFLGLSGVAKDPKASENQTAVTVKIFMDGNPTAIATTSSSPGIGFKYIFTPELLNSVISPGLHYLQVVAVDPDDSVAADPNAGTPATSLDVLLAEGEINWPASTPGGPGTNIAAGVLNEVNMQTISGTVAANINDPIPGTLANIMDELGNIGYVSPTATFRIDINNTQFVTLNQTPSGPEQGINFTVPTPQLNSSVGNVAHIYYFDPFIGILRLVATRAMDQTRVFNFVNRELNVSGNVPPSGNIDAASGNQIAGWVRDADAPGQQIQYRLDFDDSVGLPDTALLLRQDLPFSNTNHDQEHGFSITPPLLKAGSHTVKLWAIDPVTQQPFLISQRSFSILDDSNKRPIGAVDVLTGGRIAGWTQDPTSTGTAVVIELRVDGSSQGGFAGFFPTTFFRTDVVRNGANAYGFDFAMPASILPGRHFVEVYALDTSTNARRVLLKSGSVEVGPSVVSGNFDIADFTQIAGWGRAAANDNVAPKFRMDVNGVAFQTFTGVSSVENGVQLWRFAFPTPPLGISFNNTVTLYYVDPHTSESILVATKVIGPVQATTGTIDAANQSVVQGWAQSPSLPSALIQVVLLIDNVRVGVTTASLDRPDLTDQRAGHAYEFAVPPQAAGPHTYQVRFLDPITGDFSLVTQSVIVTT